MSKVYLRVANVFDSNAIVDIKNYYIKETNVIFTNEEVTQDDIAREINLNKNRYIVAECDGTIIGYTCLHDYKFGGYYITKEVSVYLKQGNIGIGIGHSLLEAIITQGKLLGLTTLVAYISSDNDKSLTLFRRNGFEVSGELKNVAIKNNAYLDVTIFQLQLK